MNTRTISIIVALLAVTGLTTMAAGIVLDIRSQPPVKMPAPGVPHAAVTAIMNVRVFDGTRMLPKTTVIIDGDHIGAMGAGLPAPAGADVINGTGRTILPGFIDAHTHASGDALERAALFGVTTELDMFTDRLFAAAARKQQATGRVTTRADLQSAGVLVTAPGGHGTEYGPIPTLSTPGEARAFVDARIAEGSDYIKIVKDDGSAYGLAWPTLSNEALAAVVAAAHWRQKLAVVHVGSQRDATSAIDAGADGLVHLFADSAPAIDFAARVASHHAFVVPTLGVLESETGRPSGASLATDSRLAPWLTQGDTRRLTSAFHLPRLVNTFSLDHARAAVAALNAAGVAILAGTDAPNPGTTHGASLHRELELLVSAGLTPVEALAAATSTPARVFGLLDRGRIATGLRADLVLVTGDPDREITATRAIVTVWRNGAVVRR